MSIDARQFNECPICSTRTRSSGSRTVPVISEFADRLGVGDRDLMHMTRDFQPTTTGFLQSRRLLGFCGSCTGKIESAIELPARDTTRKALRAGIGCITNDDATTLIRWSLKTSIFSSVSGNPEHARPLMLVVKKMVTDSTAGVSIGGFVCTTPRGTVARPANMYSINKSGSLIIGCIGVGDIAIISYYCDGINQQGLVNLFWDRGSEIHQYASVRQRNGSPVNDWPLNGVEPIDPDLLKDLIQDMLSFL